MAAAPDDLVEFLNLLLEAERAGARVATESAAAAADQSDQALLRDVAHDEARWCAMLSRHLQALGAAPSRAVGAFYGKAMAIAELRPRLVFLNRGQEWVVRRLDDMLSRLPPGELAEDLRRMRDAHRVNIARTAVQLDGGRVNPSNQADL